MILKKDIKLSNGSALTLGALPDDNGINFSIYSATAEYIELCIFDDEDNELRLPLPHRTGNVWHGYLSLTQYPLAKPGLTYGYRVYGAFNPNTGQRFNNQKLLIDPYSLKLTGTPKNHISHYGGNQKANYENSVSHTVKSIVCAPFNYAFKYPKPNHPWHKTVIYEAHAKGLTKLHPGIPKELQGTYAGLVHPIMLEHYKSLGISAIELLPIPHHYDEPRLQSMGLSNYWGYNTLAFFALDPKYASCLNGMSPEDEFCYTVDKLHEAGIEVILDVVYNHTAESDADGPTFSFKGIDNQNAYWLLPGGQFDNMTGCGNSTNLQDPGMMHLVIASLRHWIEKYGVDGFRFDLATVLGRTPAFDARAPLLEAMINDPIISKSKLIAEPWDIGLGGYQVGQFPDPFVDWNDKFRDTMRKFWLGHDITLGDFAQAFAGSSQLFSKRKSPFASVNYITAHDGFTLEDCVSYNHKHNHANGEDNRDGTNENYSNNHGVEGVSKDATILANRYNVKQSLLFTLLLSQGTPMMLAGDELNNSQNGNNNPYCLDNEISWLDWQSTQPPLTDWIKSVINYRHQILSLTEDKWWNEGEDNVQWFNQDATSLAVSEWQSTQYPILQVMLDKKWLLIFNRGTTAHQVKLPKGKWQLCLQSNLNNNLKLENTNPLISLIEIERGVCLFNLS